MGGRSDGDRLGEVSDARGPLGIVHTLLVLYSRRVFHGHRISNVR